MVSNGLIIKKNCQKILKKYRINIAPRLCHNAPDLATNGRKAHSYTMNKRAINTGFNPSFSNDDTGKQQVRRCEWPGCDQHGEHRANRSPRHMNDYVWYCTDHAREHNKSWNFFEGLSDDDVEKEIRNDTVWQRPTWKLGSGPSAHKARFGSDGPKIRDDFGVYEDAVGNGKKSTNKHEWEKRPAHDTKLMRAYALLDIDPPSSKEEVRKKYKKLVKMHHPDANGGDKKSEEKFKDVVEAYQLIMVAFDGSLL